MKKRTNTTPSQPEPKRVDVNSPTEKNDNSQPKSTFDSIRAIFSTRPEKPDLNRSMSELSIASAATAASAASNRSNHEQDHSLGGNRLGPMRNVLEIDVLFFDDKPFLSNMTEREIYKHILRLALGLRRGQINSLQLGWQGHPYIQVRLKMDVRINDFSGKHTYETKVMSTDGVETVHTVTFEVRGYTPTHTGAGFGENDNWIRWVKVEQTGLDVDKQRIVDLLSKFGLVLTPLKELTITFMDDVSDSDDDEDDRNVVLGTGKFELQMQIETHIPQYLPAYGRKMKIHYKGIEKQCTNCYATGHYKAGCKNSRVNWIDYVCWFRENFPEINAEMLGRWYTLSSIHNKKKASEAEAKTAIPVETNVEADTAEAASEAGKTSVSEQEPKPANKQSKRGRATRSSTANQSQPTMRSSLNSRAKK